MTVLNNVVQFHENRMKTEGGDTSTRLNIIQNGVKINEITEAEKVCGHMVEVQTHSRYDGT